MKRTTITLVVALAVLSLSACSTSLESEALEAPETEAVETAPSGPSWFQQLIAAAIEKARQEALKKAQAAATLEAALEALPKGPCTFPKP